MNDRNVVPKAERPQAIERILRDGRARDPGTWMTWKEILAAVGGSERDLGGMIRAAKDRILADEAATAQLPELPDDMRAECERFVLEVWRKSCELNDANASAERRARQADRERHQDERREHDEVVHALVDERDCLLERVASLENKVQAQAVIIKDKDHELIEERRRRACAETAAEELRRLFESLRAIAGEPDEASMSDRTPKANARPAKKSASTTNGNGAGGQEDDDPEKPLLPLG